MNRSTASDSNGSVCLQIMYRLMHDTSERTGYYVFLGLFIVLNGLIALTAVAFNLIVIFTIARTSSLQSSSNILVLGLAVSDLITGIVSQPMYCVLRFLEIQDKVETLCELDPIYNSVVWLVSPMTLLSLTAITADRFLAIKLHLRYNAIVTKKRTSLVVTLIFVSSCVCCASMLYFDNWLKGAASITIILLISIIAFNSYCMCSIYMVIRRHSAQIHALTQSIQSNIDMPSYKKSVFTMYYVVGAFLLCYLPTLPSLIILTVSFHSLTRRAMYLRVIAMTCVFVNGVVNPIIYFRRNEELRHAAGRILKGLWTH